MAGGYDTLSVEVLIGDLGIKKLPNLPGINGIIGSSMVQHNGTILMCGGTRFSETCVQLDRGTWKNHSHRRKERYLQSAVSTNTGTFIFGGLNSPRTYEYLPSNSTTWLLGKTNIPGPGFHDGCAISVKFGQEIWLIGGLTLGKRILSFNVNDHTFRELPCKLKVFRMRHRCAFIPNTNKIMITGGSDDYGSACEYRNSSEVLDIENESVSSASPMESKRADHGMGVVTINGDNRLAAFGGYDGRTMLDSIELYNSQSKKWETTDIKLKQPTKMFGFLSVKISDIISEF